MSDGFAPPLNTFCILSFDALRSHFPAVYCEDVGCTGHRPFPIGNGSIHIGASHALLSHASGLILFCAVLLAPGYTPIEEADCSLAEGATSTRVSTLISSSTISDH